MERTGGCLCGAIRYRATIDNPRFGACHCPMCRKWTGGPLLNVRASAITFDGTPSVYPWVYEAHTRQFLPGRASSTRNMPHLNGDRHAFDIVRFQPNSDTATDPKAHLPCIVPNCRAPARQIDHRKRLKTAIGHHGQPHPG